MKYAGFIILIGTITLGLSLSYFIRMKKEEKIADGPSVGCGAVIYKGYDTRTKIHSLSLINERGITTIKDKKLWLKADVGDSIMVTYFNGALGLLDFVDIEVIGKSIGDYSNISIESSKKRHPTTIPVPVIIPR